MLSIFKKSKDKDQAKNKNIQLSPKKAKSRFSFANLCNSPSALDAEEGLAVYKRLEDVPPLQLTEEPTTAVANNRA